MAYRALSNVELDGEMILNHGDKLTAEITKKVGEKQLEAWEADGIIVDEKLWPENFDSRPEGQSDRLGFRVSGLSEMVARQDRIDAELAEQGKVREVKGPNG